jgi:hypothetical protein
LDLILPDYWLKIYQLDKLLLAGGKRELGGGLKLVYIFF